MIINEELKIPKFNNDKENLTSKYFEDYFEAQNLDVLRWAIVKVLDDCYLVNAAVVLPPE